MSFVIAGLPRSRTAWSAAYLDAVHDPLVHCDHIADYWNVAGQGASDPSFYLIWERVLEMWDVPVVCIVRPVSECMESAEKIGIDPHVIHLMEQKRLEMRDKIDVLELDYHDLDLEAMWINCKMDPYSEFRAKRYQSMHITQIMDPTIEVNPNIINELKRNL